MAEIPRLSVCSLMRAGSPYERAYFYNILGSIQYGFDFSSVNVVYDRLTEESSRLHDLLRENGIRVHVELEHPCNREPASLSDRIKRWSDIGNQCIELALRQSPESSHFAWIESDLSYPYDTLSILSKSNVDIVAPMVYLGNNFYDSWGFRDQADRKIFSFPAISPGIGNKLIELKSVGSLVLLKSQIFSQGIRFRCTDYDDSLLVGLCHDARALGFRIYVNLSVSILHPVTAWREQIWKLSAVILYLNQRKVCELPKFNCIAAGPYQEMIEPILAPICQSLVNLRLVRTEIERKEGVRIFEAHLYFEYKA